MFQNKKLLGVTTLAVLAMSMPAAAQWPETFKLTATDAAAGDYFGSSVAIDGNTAIAGAFKDGGQKGAAYLFDVTTGSQLRKLTASDGAAGDKFGSSVAISGNTAIVGARFDHHSSRNDAGSAYLFDVTNPLSPVETKLTASDAATNDQFGISVAISGNTAIAGAFGDDFSSKTNAGSAYLFDVTNPLSPVETKLTASDAATNDEFGFSVAISGTTAIVGARMDDSGKGSAYLFDVTTGDQLFKLTASDAAANDEFGRFVAISGNTAIVGAPYDDVGSTNSGSAYVFDVTNPAAPSQLFKLTASDGAANDRFGWSVAISGNTAIVGVRDEVGKGSAYLFDVTTGDQLFKLTASDGAVKDEFGFSAAISGNTAIVGAYKDDLPGKTDAGSAYVFSAPTLYSNASAGWEVDTTWDPVQVPTALNDVVVDGGDTVTVTGTGNVGKLLSITGGEDSAVTVTGSLAISENVAVGGETLLIVDGTMSANQITIQDAGILGGGGAITATVVLDAGAVLQPGPAGIVGTLNITGDLTLADGALFTFDLGTTSDGVEVTSTLALNGQDFGDFTFIQGAGFGVGTYYLFEAGSHTGDLGASLTGPIGEFTGTLSLSGDTEVILTVVPEPNMLVLLVSGLLALLLFARRRRKR